MLFVQDETETLHEKEQYFGYAAGTTLFVLCLFSLQQIRTRFYEVFLKVHTIGYILLIVLVGLHKPDLTRKVVWIITFVGASYFLSRTFRVIILTYNSWGNSVTLVPLNGATKIVFKRRLRAEPGDHLFITIPALRSFESHPFTICDTEVTQLRCRKRDGFTKVLHEFAEQNTGKALRVIVDGPYGTTPDFSTYDKALIVAGGVGATFSFSIALDLVRRARTEQVVDFLWIVKSEGTRLDLAGRMRD